MLSKFLTKSKRKIALLLLFFFIFSALFSKPIQAFSTPNTSYQFQFESAIRMEEMNLQSFVYETLKAVVGSIVTTIYCFTCPREEGGGFGMIGTISTLIAGVYSSPPASGIAYMADIGRRLEIIQPIHAQEQRTGFERMQVVMPVWVAFRNITYVFFVLILIFMGFAIMFRVKIDPQTVITIQSALPKIVLGLILITFSYAIVGLLIDFMWVISNMIIVIFKTLPNVPEWFRGLLGTPVTSDVGMFGRMFVFGIPVILILLVLALILSVTGAIITTVSGGFAFPVGIGSFIIFAIVAVLFLIALLRVLWILLKAYTMVVLNLVFGPFQILVGVLPGSGAIGSWFRNLLANLAVFPVVLAMASVSAYLFWASVYAFDAELFNLFNSFLQIGTNPIAVIPEIASIVQNPDVFTDAITLLLFFFISLTILLLTPRASDIIQSFITRKPFGYGAAIGETLRPVTAPAGWVWGGISGEMRERAGMAAPELVAGQIGAARAALQTGSREAVTRARSQPEEPTQAA